MNEIAVYNDRVRRSLIDPREKKQLDNDGCRFQLMMTANLNHTIKDKPGMASAIANFNIFNENNDPYREHDFMTIKFEGETIHAKFDYYDPDMEHGSEDPSDLSKTVRVLTVMLAIDY